MLPEITTRSFSNDSQIFDEVFFANKYKIKGNKDPNSPQKVFLDIGAHAGFFSFLALNLNVRVYAFEPFVDNFNLLLKNCYNHNFAANFTPYNVGVYTEKLLGKFSSPELIGNAYLDFAYIGLSTNSHNKREYPCNCERLDEILATFCFGDKIDVLKISIGYSEREILTGSLLLRDQVNSICGEITANDVQLSEFKKSMGIAGFASFFSEPVKNERVVFWASKTNLSDNFII